MSYSRGRRFLWAVLLFSFFGVMAGPAFSGDGNRSVLAANDASVVEHSRNDTHIAHREPGAIKKRRTAIFGSIEFVGGSLKALPQWTRVLKKIHDESTVYKACDKDIQKCPSTAVAAWRAMKRSLVGLKLIDQVKAINRFVNKWPYRTDLQNYGVQDYWASPLQFFSKSGDCEDYAIVKYVTLRELGVPAKKLRIVVLRDALRNVPHAVLAVYIKAKIVIMDNVFDAVLTDDKFPFYIPQYSVNENKRWAHIMPIARDK